MKFTKKTKTAFLLTATLLLVTPLLFKEEKSSLNVSEVYNMHGVDTSLVEIKDSNAVFVKFKFKDAGVLHNLQQKHGLSLVVASLLFRKIGELSVVQTREQLRNLTVTNLSVDASNDDFEISFYVLKEHLTDALNFVAGAMMHPAFSDNDLEYIKDNYPVVIDLETSSPYEIMNDGLMKMLYESSAYGLNQTGTAQGISEIKSNDIYEFISQHFVKSKLQAIIVGNLSRFEVMQSLSIFFEKLSDKEPQDNAITFNAEESKIKRKDIYKKDMRNVAGVVIGIRLDGMSDHQKAATKVILSTLFSQDGDFIKSLKTENLACVPEVVLIEREYSSVFQIISYIDKENLEKYIDFALARLKKYATTQNLIHLKLHKNYLRKTAQIGIEKLEDVDRKIKEKKLPFDEISQKDFSDTAAMIFDNERFKIVTISSDIK